MKYRIFKDFSKTEKTKLQDLGINVDIGFDAFKISEKSTSFESIKNILLNDWDDIATAFANFSNYDLEKAPYLDINAKKCLGYAKPDTEAVIDTFQYPFDIYPYYKNVFKIKNTDKEYGVLRGEQIGSYSMKGEPKWKTIKVGGLFNAGDAFFTKPEIYEDIFKPLGISYLPVLDYKTKKPLNTIVQVIQQGVSNSKLDIKKLDIKKIITVDKWNMKKYILNTASYFPSFENQLNEFDFFYTQEYFGDGGLTQRATIISKKLYQVLKRNKIKGINFCPMDVKLI